MNDEMYHTAKLSEACENNEENRDKSFAEIAITITALILATIQLNSGSLS